MLKRCSSLQIIIGVFNLLWQHYSSWLQYCWSQWNDNSAKMLTLFLNSLFKSRIYEVSFFKLKLSMHDYGRFSDKWSLIMRKVFLALLKMFLRNVKYDFKIFQINLCTQWRFFFVFMANFLWGLSYFSIMYQSWFLLDQLIDKNLKMLRSFAHKGHGQIWTFIGHACIPYIWPFHVCHLLKWIFVSYIESKLWHVEINKKIA